jgi:hypothetical protein
MLNKKNKGNSLLIETEFGDIDLVLFENCIIITRPVSDKLKKNKNLYNLCKKITDFNDYKKTSILIIEKKILNKIKSKT